VVFQENEMGLDRAAVEIEEGERLPGQHRSSYDEAVEGGEAPEGVLHERARLGERTARDELEAPAPVHEERLVLLGLQHGGVVVHVVGRIEAQHHRVGGVLRARAQQGEILVGLPRAGDAEVDDLAALPEVLLQKRTEVLRDRHLHRLHHGVAEDEDPAGPGTLLPRMLPVVEAEAVGDDRVAEVHPLDGERRTRPQVERSTDALPGDPEALGKEEQGRRLEEQQDE